MSKANSGWVRKQTAVLLSVTLALSPVLVVPAMAGETDGDAAPQEQAVENGEQSTDEGVEKDVEQTGEDSADATSTEGGATDPATDATANATDPATDAAPAATANAAEVNGTPYATLDVAVAAVNKSGGTLTLLESTPENISISHAGVTVTASQGVVYSGSLTLAEKCIVENMSFTNPGSTEVGKGFSNCITMANGAIVRHCTFTVPSGVWAKKPEGYMWWQPNCISVSGKQGCTIENNTFNLGRINEKNADGTIADSDSNVAINLIGPNVSNITIAGNTMNVTAPVPEATVGGGICFVFSSGNQNSDPAYGVSGVKLENNTFNGSGDPTNARFAGFSDSDGLVIQGNNVSNAATGVYQGSYLQATASASIKEMVDNNIDAPNTLVKANVTVDGHTYSFSSVSDAINSERSNNGTVQLTQNVTENVTIPDDKTVTLDLAGHTLTNAEDLANGQGTITVEEGGSLTLTDSSKAGTGTVDSTKHATGALVNHGEVVVESGTLTRSQEAGSSPTDGGGNSWYVIDNHGTMTFDGGTVTSTGKFSSLVRNAAGTLTINDGSFSNGFIALKNEDATLIVNGGTISSDEQSIQNWGTATLSGGTLNGRVATWAQDGAAGTTTIEDGVTINGDVQSINYKNADLGPKVIITGGAINGAVIKATHDGSTGTTPADPSATTSQITISGGSFSTRPDDALLASDLDAYERPDGSFGVAKPDKIFTVTIDGKKAQLAEGEKLAKPADPAARVGYTFLGWYADGSDTPYDFNAPVTDNLTVSQRWSLDADVSVSVSDPKPTEGDTVTLSASATSAAPGVSYAYQWLLDGKEIAGATQATYAATTDGTYTVRVTATDADQVAWTFTSAPVSLAFAAAPQPEQPAEKTYDVTFVWADGSTVTYLDIPEGSYVNAPTDAPTIDGWTFTGVWYTTRSADGTLSGVFDPKTMPVTSDLTLYAGWVPAGQQGQPEVPQTTPVEQQKPADEKSGKLAQTSDPTSAAPVAVAAAAGVSALAAAVATRRKRD